MKSNYLNNKDILKEIHRSKNTYCSYIKPEYADYDIIVHDVNLIDTTMVDQARSNRADRLTKLAQEQAALKGEKKKADEVAVEIESIPVTDIIFRVMTWEHVPVLISNKKPVEEIEIVEELHTEYDVEEDAVKPADTLVKYVKCNFPPFQHYKFNTDGELTCVGKSHWRGNLDDGEWSREHGSMTKTLATMFIKLCERYATRSNWRGYCVDSETETLTQRGWLTHDQITELDKILSFNGEKLIWSTVKSIYKDHNYNGLMHYVTSRGIDSLITPNHKIVTTHGLVPIELIKQSDKIIVMGRAEAGTTEPVYNDFFVELAGWILTEGCYEVDENNKIKRITVYQNRGKKADRIRNCLNSLNYEFSENSSPNICFGISRKHSREFTKIFPEKNLSMDFILSLTSQQRELLIETMIDGDGWRRGNNKSYTQKSKSHIDLFQALLTLSGKKSNLHWVNQHWSYGKQTDFYTVNIFSQRGNTTNGSCLNLHGGKNTGRKTGNVGQGKVTHPNTPTVKYSGTVWCPETEYGCFVARRNGKVYLTGNTYNDEMRSQALLQLSQIGLQFDESKSQNPFAYYTAAITNSFTRVLNIEKRNQNLRDDILEMNNFNPSYTRQGMSNGYHSDDHHD